MSWLNINIAVVWYSILYTHSTHTHNTISITSSCGVYFMEFEFPKVSMHRFSVIWYSFIVVPRTRSPRTKPSRCFGYCCCCCCGADDEEGALMATTATCYTLNLVIFELLTFHSTYASMQWLHWFEFTINKPERVCVLSCVRVQNLCRTLMLILKSQMSHIHIHMYMGSEECTVSRVKIPYEQTRWGGYQVIAIRCDFLLFFLPFIRTAGTLF